MSTTAMATELRNGTWDVVARRTTATFIVRNWGLIRVRGTIGVAAGEVTISNGEPVAAAATLDAASVSTGIKKRDLDLTGRHFFAAAEHPHIQVAVRAVQPSASGWNAKATVSVAGGSAPVDLTVRREPDRDGDGTIRVVATGVLDRSATPIRAPRFLVGRWITIEVDATLRQRA